MPRSWATYRISVPPSSDSMKHLGRTKNESFHFFRRNFGFRWPAIRKRGRNADGRNFAKFRLKSAKNGCRRKIGEIFKKSPDTAIYRRIFGLYRRFFFPIFGEFSRYFLPVQPAHRMQNLIMKCRQRLCFLAWLKNRGFRVREI